MPVIIDVVLAVAAVGTTVIAYLQYRGKQAEGVRADKAEEARDRMADELAGTREELARSSAAHERLADIELEAASAERSAARDALRQQKRLARDADRAASKALSEQKRQASKETRDRKAHEKKMLDEQKKQRRAAEKAAREARRKR